MKWLRHYREKMGMSQVDLAAKVGVKPNTIWRWENDKATPSVEIAKVLAEILNISESDLLNGPAPEIWELRVICKKTLEGDELDLTGKSSNAYVLLGERAMSIKIDGPIDLWTDDQKFEDLIADLRRKRAAGMKTRKEGW